MSLIEVLSKIAIGSYTFGESWDETKQNKGSF